MTLKEELEQIYKEQEALKERERDVYKRSLEAPDEDKVCQNGIAEALATPFGGFIKFPISVLGINTSCGELFLPSRSNGFLVSIRPCDDECKGKTYLGIHLGSMVTYNTVSHHPDSGILSIHPGGHNPAIFVPDLKRVVFGHESWWGRIKSIEQVRKITDEDIEGTWYVKLLKEQLEG